MPRRRFDLSFEHAPPAAEIDDLDVPPRDRRVRVPHAEELGQLRRAVVGRVRGEPRLAVASHGRAGGAALARRRRDEARLDRVGIRRAGRRPGLAAPVRRRAVRRRERAQAVLRVRVQRELVDERDEPGAERGLAAGGREAAQQRRLLAVRRRGAVVVRLRNRWTMEIVSHVSVSHNTQSHWGRV